jgi:uncharacterized 2Fe-2S/4Fe-4S cluster protein (DUF4445 family)
VPATLTLNGQTTAVVPGLTLFEHAERLGVRVPTSCKKQGKCKECLVEITEGQGALSPATPEEQHLRGRFRLSCRTTIAGEADVRCHTMRRGQMRVLTGCADIAALHAGLVLDPAVTRDGDRILIDGEEVTRSSAPIHGLAMDLGTTTVVLRLYDLESGALVADTSFENPQRFGGSDVMARIQYDTEHGGFLLMRTLAGYVSHAIEEFPVDPQTIYELVVVGNATMRDLFFRQNVHSIGQSPYQSITELEVAEGKRDTTSLVASGRRLLLPIHPKARVYGLPIISGHVGADAAACLLAVDLAHAEKLTVVMDIGTNTELLLGYRGRILAASCPAGPAFEGGAISCGMPALDGAVATVAACDDGSFTLGVIGDGPAEGLCGSGLVDTLSELLRTERMNAMGRFEDGESKITLDAATGVGLLESDVNELAQAKGANVAGLRVVLDTFGVDVDAIDLFYLAGGFGRHLRLEAAQRIGLVPTMPAGRIVQVGNAAIEGATLALLSRAKRAELEAAVRRVEHCRLETHPNFFDFFVDGCQFTPIAVSATSSERPPSNLGATSEHAPSTLRGDRSFDVGEAEVAR